MSIIILMSWGQKKGDLGKLQYSLGRNFGVRAFFKKRPYESSVSAGGPHFGELGLYLEN